jgi:chromate transport protein ChrA
MTFLENIIMALLHLVFAAMDILTLIILLEAIRRLFDPKWLRPVISATKPLLDAVLIPLNEAIHKATNRRYDQRKLMMILLALIMVLRTLITVIF